MELGLTDRTFIVTGGTSGLGLATAQVLVAEGANVVVSSRSEANVAAAVAGLGARAHGVAADLTDPACPGALIAAAREAFGALHGAFVSHGGPPRSAAAELDDATMREAFELAAIAPIRLIREVAAVLDAGGSIVALTSTSSVQPITGLAASNIARPAVWGYVKTLADEVAPRGVRVNVLIPGRYATPRTAGWPAGDAPLGRDGQPEELGRVAAFLLSDAASYVTGSAWSADGGAIRGL